RQNPQAIYDIMTFYQGKDSNEEDAVWHKFDHARPPVGSVIHDLLVRPQDLSHSGQDANKGADRLEGELNDLNDAQEKLEIDIANANTRFQRQQQSSQQATAAEKRKLSLLMPNNASAAGSHATLSTITSPPASPHFPSNHGANFENQRAPPSIPQIVGYVKSSSRFAILYPREMAKLTSVLSCIRVPRSARNPNEKAEPFGQEAHDFATRRCLQRDIEIAVESSLWMLDFDACEDISGDLSPPRSFDSPEPKPKPPTTWDPFDASHQTSFTTLEVTKDLLLSPLRIPTRKENSFYEEMGYYTQRSGLASLAHLSSVA
ncbi:MAG: hypothetical protein Q9221_004944, partial [Calogaya cf. arnoldii]